MGRQKDETIFRDIGLVGQNCVDITSFKHWQWRYTALKFATISKIKEDDFFIHDYN